ncbi:MAG: DUF1343 domain-containing protein [Salibacteraceae bacterium]
MQKWLGAVVLFLLFGALSAQVVYKTGSEITVGAGRYEVFKPDIDGKSIAVCANHTSMVDSVHLVDFLLSKGHGVVKVFSPEHGFRGVAGAGEAIEDQIDTKTGLPVISLYGKNKKPTAADLAGIDVVIFDIQDVGARFYTYISTLYLLMEACAENDVELIVLDRPNPNGFYVDGPVLESQFKSFVGMLPIPVVHGMTVGELARMINGEGWLQNSVKCDLKVVPCLHYLRNNIYVLPVSPSPNLRNMNAVLLYPSLCFFEGTQVSVGRGTDHPFECFGHPNFTQGNFVFVPKSTEGAPHPKHEGVPCVGWDLRQFGGNRVVEKQHMILDWLVNAYRDFPDKGDFFLKNGFFDKLAGTDQLRKQIEAGMSAEEIRATWQADLNRFKKQRQPYLIYDES